MFDLAWSGKGLTLDLAKVPDDMLEKFLEWRGEYVDAQNAQLENL